MKTISVRQFASIKRVAQNVNLAVTKKNKIAAQLEKLNEEYNNLVAEIDAHEMGIKSLTGYGTEDLVQKVVYTTDKVDKDGKPIKVTKWEPKDNVVFNEDTKVYEVHELIMAEMPKMGNDYDLDKETLANMVDETAVAPEKEELPAEGFDPTSYQRFG